MDALLAAARMGLSKTKAAGLVGITPATLDTWLLVGNGAHETRKPTKQLVRLAKGWARSRAEFVVGNLRSLNEAANGYIETTHETIDGYDKEGNPRTETRHKTVNKRDWRAAAWLLERSEPEEYAEKRIEHKPEGEQDPFVTKVIEIERSPGRRIEPKTDVSEMQAGADRPDVLLIPHVTDERESHVIPEGSP